MSLQVCHCGWSKMTSYHGLRTHQGMKGCTPKGARVAQSDQQYLWGFVGASTTQLDVKLDIYTSIKTDTTDCYSHVSLQVCHCGWESMTTYRGLRIHQGKKGCTAKGMKIPKKEQYDWNNQYDWEAEVDHRKPAKRVAVKKESLPPRRSSGANSVATTVQDDYMSPARRSSRRATRSKSAQQLQQLSSLLQNTDSRAAEYWSTDSGTDYAAGPIKEEPKSPFAVSQPPFQRATRSKSGQRLQDFSTDVQMNRNVREPPILVPAGRPKQKHREGQTLSQVDGRLVREHPAPTYLGNVVRLKEKNPQNQTLSQNTDRAVEYWSVASAPDYAAKSAAPKEEPKLSFAAPQPSLHGATKTKSSHQMQDSSTDVQVSPNAPPPVPAVRSTETSKKDPTTTQENRSVREHPKIPPPVLPKRKDSLIFKVRQEKPKSELQQKLQKREAKLTDFKPVEPVCETLSVQSVEDATGANNQTTPAAAEASAKDDPASLDEAAQPDSSTGMTVKELARMFSATTNQEPKTEGVEQKPSQVKLLAGRFSASTVRETTVQPKEKDTEEQGVEQVNAPIRKHPKPPPPVLPKKQKDALLLKARQENSKSEPQQTHQAKEEKIADIRPAGTVYEKVPETASTKTQVPGKEDPTSLDEAAQPGSSSGMTVKELARMFSATTHQEPENEGVEPRPSQAKLPARRFSAVTGSKTAVQPKEKDKEEEKVAQAKLLAPKFSASTVREITVQPKEKDTDEHKLSQKLPNPTDAATRMNPAAAAEAPAEKGPRSSCETAQPLELSAGVKVKDLIRMFSATTTQETVQTKEKRGEQNLPRW